MAAATGKDSVASLIAGDQDDDKHDAHESEGSAHAQVWLGAQPASGSAGCYLHEPHLCAFCSAANQSNLSPMRRR